MKPGAILILCAMALGAQSPAMPEKWFLDPILPEETRRSEMYAFVNANIPPLPRFASLAEWTAQRQALKARILRTLGIDDILAANSLRVTHRGTLERAGYTVEKIYYESYPGMFVPALVWAPKGLRAKAPAMVSISGHLYCDSKAGGYVQERNYNLVRRGFIVVSYDYFGCFERARTDPCVKGAWGGEDHTNSLYSYTRRTPTGIEALDGIRAVDYLCSRPDVDRSRIGFTGESGGGNNTYWVSALDDRVTLSVPVSSAGAYEQWIRADTNYDWHQRPPGLRAFADIGTLYALMAPKPLLIMNGTPELAEFALPDALRSFEYAKAIYRLYGKEDRIAFHSSTTGHGYQPDKRQQLYRWLNRWFFGGKMPEGDRELPYTPEARDNLRVGLPENNLTIPALARRWVEEALAETALPRGEREAREFQARQREALEPLVARKDPGRMPPVVYRAGDALVSGEVRADRLQLEVDADLLIPGVFLRKGNRPKYQAVLMLEKRRGLSPQAQALVERGYAVFALDVRGTGEMEWGGGRTSNWANFVGRPPVGMWAEDVSKAVTYLLGRPDVESVAVLGFNLFGKVALYAAALDTRIAAAALSTDSLSYRQEATSGLNHVYADVPHILAWGDTPQLAALVAPRPLAILSAGPPDTRDERRRTYFSPLPRFAPPGTTVPPEDLAAAYEWTRRFYGLFGAQERFETGPRDVAQWFAQTVPHRNGLTRASTSSTPRPGRVGMGM